MIVLVILLVIVWILGAVGAWMLECLYCGYVDTGTLPIALVCWPFVLPFSVRDAIREIEYRRKAGV